jgi:hypothetical protein
LSISFSRILPFADRKLAALVLLLSIPIMSAMTFGSVPSTVSAFDKGTVSWENPQSRCCPIDLRHLVVRTRPIDTSPRIPPVLVSKGVRVVVFRFMGTKTFFLGITVQAIGSGNKILRHGLFDQGPITEVLTKSFFGTVERVRIAGIFERHGKMYLVLERERTKKEAWIPLSSALSSILSNIGKQDDLAWGVS